MYEVMFAEDVAHDLESIDARDRNPILEAIMEQLTYEPTVTTRHRKVLEGLVPPFEHVPPVWQLAVREFRVFYDVDVERKQVNVRAIRRKPTHRTTKEIL